MSKKITISEKQAAEPFNFTLDLWQVLAGLSDGEGIHIAPTGTYVKRKGDELYYYNSSGDRMGLRLETLMNAVRSFYRGEYKAAGKYRIPTDAEEIQVSRRASLSVDPVDSHYLGMLRTTLKSLEIGGKMTVTVFARYGRRKAPITIERTTGGYLLKHKSYSFTSELRGEIITKAIKRAKARPSVA